MFGKYSGKWLLAIVVVAALSGCIGPTQFVNPNGSPSTFEVDKQACLYEVQLHQPQNPELWPMSVRSCLATKGWRPVSKRVADRKWPYA